MTQPNSFQNESCQVAIGRNYHHTFILHFLWQFNNTVLFSFLLLSSSLHLSSSFIYVLPWFSPFGRCDIFLPFFPLGCWNSSFIFLHLSRLILVVCLWVINLFLSSFTLSGIFFVFPSWDCLIPWTFALCKSRNILFLHHKNIKYIFMLVGSFFCVLPKCISNRFTWCFLI